ncbi:MAG TPA: hypothetical protein EYP09_01825 [Anaerolineae bacterium]|nr:hypothetical protein [Anaerolineae bacterium]
MARFRRKGNAPGEPLSSIPITLRERGVITIPGELRKRYDLRPGDVLRIIDLGEGCFVIAPGVSRFDHWARRFREEMEREGVSLEGLLEGLEEERQRYYEEHYAGKV